MRAVSTGCLGTAMIRARPVAIAISSYRRSTKEKNNNCVKRNSFVISQLLFFSHPPCVTRELPLAYWQVPFTRAYTHRHLSSSHQLPDKFFVSAVRGSQCH